ncbi:MAG: UDP-2,4-diacetamido-2,4,6-trideoxy-beta-L-altropyranose hydrolase, partial [Deltaproteobacteria bacterium]|nr:UDP-2,4-diacetamido-2,4,6-trideoxy-beta-L-altropyranose hydrolase [Deltaproteobacteria bacterium]
MPPENSEKSGTLFIRADAESRIGTGHLMRCLALAQAWRRRRRGRVVFLSHCDSPSLKERIIGEGFFLQPVDHPHPHPSDLEGTLEAVSRRDGNGASPGWLVLDGYHFDPIYQRAVRESGSRVLVIDDEAKLPRYHADLLLNQNMDAEESAYSCEGDPRFLLGSTYILLREEFLRWRDWRREIPAVAHRVLVTLGGADRNNVTLKVLDALRLVGASGMEIKVLVGPSNPHLRTLEDAASPFPVGVGVHTEVKAMPDLMAWADMAVCAGGTTCWEMAFMGLPNLVIVTADNQAGVAEALQRRGCSVNL